MISDVVENGYYMDKGVKEEYSKLSSTLYESHGALSKKFNSKK